MNYHQAASDHLTTFFTGHPHTEHRFGRGPMAQDADFRVLRFEQGPRTALWTYASVGASAASPASEQIEFFILSPFADDRVTELVTMIAHYHRTQHLGVQHMLPVGEPWLRGSSCDCFLISQPYPFGPLLETMDTEGMAARFLWLLPITSAERQFARQHGPEALEERFDETGLQYWDLTRKSVV
jgi:hypothetical protein